MRVFGIWKLPIGYCAVACEIWSVLPRFAFWAWLGASFINYSKVAQDSPPKQSRSVFRRNTDPVSNGTCKRPIDCRKQKVESLSNGETFTMNRARRKENTLCPTGFKRWSSTCVWPCAPATAKATCKLGCSSFVACDLYDRIRRRSKEAAWPSGQRVGLAIRWSRVWVPIWPLAGFVLVVPSSNPWLCL